MANYVVWLGYRLQNCEFERYEQLVQLSLASVERHLEGRWTPVVLTGDYSDRKYIEGVSAMYRDLLRALEDWHGQGDSVLHLDPDVVFTGPTRIFGRFPQLRLFWHTDPSERLGFKPYLNAGVVYIPASMDAGLWWYAHHRKLHEWNDSQDVFNSMFYDQDPVPTLHPELNWSPWVPSPIEENEALIVHLNSTRGPDRAIAEMKRLMQTV